LQQVNDELESYSPQCLLQWLSDNVQQSDVVLTSAFGLEGVTLIHICSILFPKVHIINLDTGYQFKETLQLKTRLENRYNLKIRTANPEHDVKAYEKLHNGALYESDPDRCCFDRKVNVLEKAVVGFQIWMSGIRRDQSPARAATKILEFDKRFNLYKFSPMINWTRKDVRQFIKRHDVPYNPLNDQGFSSIGCWPCSKMTLDGGHERSGRWTGKEKTECGLHHPIAPST
jgi:phosphoadenosine phosphosulfate reductase